MVGAAGAAVVLLLAVMAGFVFNEEVGSPGTPAAVATAGTPASFPVACNGKSWWVAPDASNGDGSREFPFDLNTALSANSPAQPCDVIWLRGGTYQGPFVSSLRGTDGAPIVVRQAPSERAVLDGSSTNDSVLTAKGKHVWFWGFEVTSSDPDRVSAEAGAWPSDLKRGTGVSVQGSDLKFINLLVHDLTRGFNIGADAINTEVYGSLIFHNGWEGAGGSVSGHGIETLNRVGMRRFTDNVVFNQFSHGIIAYTSAESRADNITLEGNILFNNGVLSGKGYERDVLIGGGSLAQNPVLRANVTYGSAQTSVGFGQGCRGARLEDNLFLAPFILGSCDAVVGKNIFYGDARKLATSYPDNLYHDARPAGIVVRIRPNQYEKGRANIAVYNGSNRASVEVDLSGSGLEAGTKYEIRDVQNFFGRPLASGTFSTDAPTIVIRLADFTVAKPIGKEAPQHTGPEFTSFVVVPLSHPSK